ncbi:MAG: 3-isopropylmalate dehydrogenase [Bacillota bacterium]
MHQIKLALLPGDGIGPEVTAEAVRVLDAAAKRFGFAVSTKEGLIGGCAIDKTGVPLPEETLLLCRECDAVLLGAVGGPKWDHLGGATRPEAGLLGIRAELGLYANLRPAIVHNALISASPLRSDILGDSLDILIVRELTGGMYFGERGRVQKDGVEAAFDTELYSVPEIERIARVAFESARSRSGRVCSVDKANVLESSRLWRETVTALHKEYPDIVLEHMYVDNAAMQLVRNPHQFDVIVTSNIFGDILSDLASQITGSIGMLPSASIGSRIGLYEPVHGSAPDIAGKSVANPLAAILSVAMMLKYSFGLHEASAAIEDAVAKVLYEGIRTPDIAVNGISVTTRDMGAHVAACVSGA